MSSIMEGLYDFLTQQAVLGFMFGFVIAAPIVAWNEWRKR